MDTEEWRRLYHNNTHPTENKWKMTTLQKKKQNKSVISILQQDRDFVHKCHHLPRCRQCVYDNYIISTHRLDLRQSQENSVQL